MKHLLTAMAAVLAVVFSASVLTSAARASEYPSAPSSKVGDTMDNALSQDKAAPAAEEEKTA